MIFQTIIDIIKYLRNTKTDTELVGKGVIPVIKPPVPSPELLITWLPSPNFNSRHGHVITAIVLHDTGGTLAATLAWFQDKESGVSSHYVIAKDGTIYQMVKDEDRAWDVGESMLEGESNVNNFSVGIEVVGNGVAAFTEEQMMSLKNLCKKLMQKFSITSSRVVGHKEVAMPLGRKTDPSPFDLDSFRASMNS